MRRARCGGFYHQALYVYVIVGAVLAGFVQGLSGFAFGLVAMSVWAWTLEPQLAAVLALFGALTGQVIAAVTVRRAFDKSLLWPFVLGGLVGVPFVSGCCRIWISWSSRCAWARCWCCGARPC